MSFLGSVARKDGRLNGSAIGDGFIRVNALVGFLAIEVIGYQLDDTRNTSGTTDEDNLVNAGLVDLGISENLFHGFEGAAEEVLAKFFEAGMSKRSVEIDALIKRVDFNRGLGGGGEGTLRTLASGTEPPESTRVRGNILLVFAFEFLNEEIDESVIEIFTSKVGIASSGLDLENAFFDGQKEDIESSTSEIENKNIAFTR